MIKKIKAALLDINNSIDDLFEHIERNRPEVVIITRLPLFKKKEEEEGVSYIKVETREDLPVVEIRGIFKQFYANDITNSSKITQKFPGMIVMERRINEFIIDKISQINQYKGKFKQLYSEASHYNRFEKLHDTFPGLITLQVTRKIPYNEPYEAIKKISFYWHKNVITKGVTKEEMLTKLYRSLGNIGEISHLSLEGRAKERARLMGYIEIINDLPRESTLRINRSPLIPSPAINTRIRLEDGSVKTLNEKASLPKFIFNHPEKIAVLSDYQLGEGTRSNRAGKSNYRELIGEIGLEVRR